MSDGEQDQRRLWPEAGLGARLAEARERKGVSQSELGRLVGMPSKQVSRYERGETSPATSQLRRLCDALEVTPSWLVYGTDEPFPSGRPLVDRLFAGGEREALTRVAALLSLLDVNDRRTVADLVLRIVQLQHGDEAAEEAVLVADWMREHMERDPDWMAKLDQTADELSERGEPDRSS